MQQIALDGVELLVDHHDRRSFAAMNREIENRVVAGFAAEDLNEFLGINGHGNRVLEASIDNGGGEAAPAGAPRFALFPSPPSPCAPHHRLLHCSIPWWGR